jgi:hypothetical protein
MDLDVMKAGWGEGFEGARADYIIGYLHRFGNGTDVRQR